MLTQKRILENHNLSIGVKKVSRKVLEKIFKSDIMKLEGKLSKQIISKIQEGIFEKIDFILDWFFYWNACIPHQLIKNRQKRALKLKPYLFYQIDLSPSGLKISGLIDQLSDNFYMLKGEINKKTARMKDIILINKNNFAVKKQTSNSGIFLLVENAKANSFLN